VDRYELLQFVHVAAAIVWVGGAAMIQFFALRTIGSSDPLRLVAFIRDAETIANRALVPSALVVIVFGFLLVWDGPYEIGMTWIWLALVLFGLSFVLGTFVLTPEGKRIRNLIDTEGPESPAAQARIKRVVNLSRIDLVILFAIVFLMVTKPD
jgi:uncharacterized membrane protein